MCQSVDTLFFLSTYEFPREKYASTGSATVVRHGSTGSPTRLTNRFDRLTNKFDKLTNQTKQQAEEAIAGRVHYKRKFTMRLANSCPFEAFVAKKRKPRIHEYYSLLVGRNSWWLWLGLASTPLSHPTPLSHRLRSIRFFTLFPADRADLRRLFSCSEKSPPSWRDVHEPPATSQRKRQLVDTLFPLAPTFSPGPRFPGASVQNGLPGPPDQTRPP
jgi:hypothetical protein